MNERIKELASCNERIQDFFLTGPVQRAAIEQFAELIVRECADIASNPIPGAFTSFDKNILDHFGLKQQNKAQLNNDSAK